MHFLDQRRQEADDVLSTTMFKALNHFIDTAGEVANARAWLTTILHNACMDGHRSARRRGEIFAETEAEELENLPPDQFNQARTPEEILRSRESLETLSRLIQALSPALREPLLLRTVEHLSYGEIAQRLALTEVNVRKRVQQARDQLRAALQRTAG
ncbi:MAG TPA: sigma-70 family RNA polymerase sigma factor [Rhodocyclaceae bacterium]